MARNYTGDEQDEIHRIRYLYEVWRSGGIYNKNFHTVRDSLLPKMKEYPDIFKEEIRFLEVGAVSSYSI